MFLRSPTYMMRNRISNKAEQLLRVGMTSVLVITALHDGGHFLLGPKNAVNFLLSDLAFTTPIGGEKKDFHLSTDLKRAMFFEPDPNDSSRIVPCRQSLSAVLLMPISGDRLNAIGILHPEPTYPLNVDVFPKIPFLRISNWPIKEGRLLTEWVISDPYASAFSLNLEL